MFTQAHPPMINHLTSYLSNTAVALLHVHRHGHRLKRAEMNEGWLLMSLETLVRCWQALPRAKWHVIVMSPLLSFTSLCLPLRLHFPSVGMCWLCFTGLSDSTFFSFCFHSILSISLPLVVDTACTGCAMLL